MSDAAIGKQQPYIPGYRDLPGFQGTAVEEYCRVAIAASDRVLVHDAAIDPCVAVLGTLAQFCKLGIFQGYIGDS